jgi:hypothetical protein
VPTHDRGGTTIVTALYTPTIALNRAHTGTYVPCAARVKIPGKFTFFCNSHWISHNATSFIDMETETSTAENEIAGA